MIDSIKEVVKYIRSLKTEEQLNHYRDGLIKSNLDDATKNWLLGEIESCKYSIPRVNAIKAFIPGHRQMANPIC